MAEQGEVLRIEQDAVFAETVAPAPAPELHFHLTVSRIQDDMTLGMQAAIEDLQDGIFHPRDWRDLLALFLTDENDNYLPEADAKRAVNKLKGDSLRAASVSFSKALAEFTLPKANAAG